MALAFGLAQTMATQAGPDRLVPVFDSQGFSNRTIYPLGDLKAVADGPAQWTPASGSARPAELIAVESAPSNYVMRRHQSARQPTDCDVLDFPPVANTQLTIAFEARVSTAQTRTLDLTLMRPGQTAGSQQASVLIWGHHPGYLSYYDGGYQKLTPIDDQWHRYELVHDLSANVFAVRMDGKMVATDIPWRNRFAPGTAFGRLRIGSIRGQAGEFADLTNLRLLARPTSPAISVVGAASASGIIARGEPMEFEVVSDLPVEAASITLQINGQDYTDRLRITGPPRQRSVTLSDTAALKPNTSYEAVITASNARGSTTRKHAFYTFVNRVDGYRGIWFTLGEMSGEYGDKYSGGLAFCFSHTLVPMAVHAPEVNKTFFVYGGTTGPENRYLLVMASYYDHARHRVPRPTIVRDQRGVNDPHDNPSISIDAEGYIWVFVAGRARHRPGQIFRATKPYSVDEFEQIAEREMTYSQIWHIRDKGFFHLLTKYTKGRELYWETSRDGRNWTEQRMLAGFGGHYQVSRLHGDGKTIGTAFNYHPKGVNTRCNLYYAQTADFGETWTTVDGRPLATPLNDRNNPALLIDYEAQGQLVYVNKLVFDAEGHPVILYVTGGGHAPGPQNDPRLVRITRWTGEKWVTLPVTPTDHNYDTGSLFVMNDRWTVIAPSLPGPQRLLTGGEVGLWESFDQGLNWKLQRHITQGSPFNHSYVRRPHNPVDPFYAMWADGDSSQLSISRLYFTNSRGDQLYQLPYDMTGEFATPEEISSR
jgi:hypothetical protein